MDNTFQIVLLGAFILFALVGVVLFASPNLLPSDSERPPVSFTVWGEWDSDQFDALLDSVGLTEDESVTISYRMVSADQFEEQLVNALARGAGPDVVLIPHTKLLLFADLITVIGEDFYPARQFRDSFVEGSEVFMSSGGVAALPVAVDPLVMYWNRDILTESRYITPPATWGEVSTYVRNITESDNAGNISTAGIALGTIDNITYLKPILSSLFLQAGNPVAGRDQNGLLVGTLSDPSSAENSISSAVRLYTQYADPDTSLYSWNNSFSSDEQAFLAGNLAFYFGMSSDVQRLRNRNPNLNFDVAEMPQLSNGQRRTYGNFYGLAILNRASNKASILSIIQELTGTEAQEALVTQTSYTPVSKGVLSAGSRDAYKQVFFDSAIIARGWMDPDPDATHDIFANMIRDTISGRRGVQTAIQVANTALSNLLDSFNE